MFEIVYVCEILCNLKHYIDYRKYCGQKYCDETGKFKTNIIYENIFNIEWL